MKRFWNKVKIKSENECWPWKGASTDEGYGRFRFKGKLVGANRLAYALSNNVEIPAKNIFICHTCDNPVCVNPKHLFAGTRSDNMKDAAKKGRLPAQYDPKTKKRLSDQAKGKISKARKLKPNEVRYIRKVYSPFNREYGARSLASKFGLHHTKLIKIIKKETYANIN